MNKKLNLIYLSFALLLAFTGCSSNNDTKDPEGTVTLNVMNEMYGKTLLANSDIYINKANNFKTQSCYMVDAGAASSLNTNYQPDLQNITHEVAVQSKHLYYFYDSNSILEFPSGKRAVYLGASYYKVIVNAPIMDNGINKGAIVKYVSCYPSPDNLPAVETTIGNMTSSGDQLTYSVPKDAECAAGSYLNSDSKHFDIHLDNGTLTIKLKKDVDHVYGPYGDYTLYVRSGNVYTSLIFHIVEH
jgi:hypothetical protein